MYVITGGSDGLGLSLATLMSKQGKRVVSLSRSAPKAKGVAHIACDLNNEASINAAATELLAAKEPIDALINCAGIFFEEPAISLSAQKLALTFTTNIIGPQILTSRLLERLVRDNADIVNVASTSGLRGNAEQAGYGSSKWAMRGFSKVLQEELKGTGVRVISFCPGGMNTDIFKKGDVAVDASNWMQPKDVAAFMWQILQLPKTMEVSEVIINRK